MLDFHELKQFVAFADLGTLSRVAEDFHVSTSSVTRAMRHVEDSFGVPLFRRGKNKIELNATGKTAVDYARKLLGEADQAVRQVRAFEQRRKTIVVKSCAPAPLWELQRELHTRQPDMTVSSAICQNDEVLSAWEEGSCDIAVLPFSIDGAKPFMREKLFVCVPPDHTLAKHASLTFAEINAFNFLLRTELGFWDTLCREKMPASRFLIQPDVSVFDELVKASSLPCFSTDYGQLQGGYPNRIHIPLADDEAHVTFHVLERFGNERIQTSLAPA